MFAYLLQNQEIFRTIIFVPSVDSQDSFTIEYAVLSNGVSQLTLIDMESNSSKNNKRFKIHL